MLTTRIAIIFLLSTIIKADNVTNAAFSKEFASSVSESSLCCTIGDYSFQSVDDTVKNLINIVTVKVTKSCIVLNLTIPLDNLKDVAIIGIGSPTVN